jgi:L-lactate dehydrogenase complex protein LldE
MSDQRRVALFVTCLVDLLFPEVGEATVAVLEDLGVAVDFPEGQTCCGQPAFNSGYVEDARRVARTLLDAMDTADAVVSPSGSCAGMIRSHYPGLFKGTVDEDRARRLAAKTYEVTEFLVDVLGVQGWRGRWTGRVTYHDSCHGLRDLGLTSQGRRLLAAIDGLELVEMERPDLCCGFGGTFSVRLPDLASAMADERLSEAAATEAATIVLGDAGCLMHLNGRASRVGSNIRAKHVVSVLAEARGLVPRSRERLVRP